MTDKITLGLCVDFSSIKEKIPWAAKNGCETVSITSKAPMKITDMREKAKEVLEITGSSGVNISTIGVYGNPLALDEDFEELKITVQAARYFHTEIVSSFAGALPCRSVEDAIPVFRERFSELARMAEDSGVKIAFENCLQGGTWKHATTNIAFNARAWTMMKEAVPSEALGLEWEPAHQLAQLTDPIMQLDVWADDVIHVHGKDARVNRDFIKREGIFGNGYIAGFCNPGNGDTDWKDIVAILRKHHYSGSISLESGHDPVWKDEMQETGDAKALAYLKKAILSGQESGGIYT